MLVESEGVERLRGEDRSEVYQGGGTRILSKTPQISKKKTNNPKLVASHAA